MAPYAYDEHGRRVMAPSKGEQREKAILDQTEKQLIEVGPDGMTVESIANAAGITRGALYFYFRSKNDVLAALVQRIVVELTGAVASREKAAPGHPQDAIMSALELTEDLWSRHGAVMRAAVDLSPSVPVIANLWNGARDEIVDSVQLIAIHGGVPDEPGPAGAATLCRILVGATERSFYEGSVHARPLNEVTRGLETVWTRTLNFSE